MQRCSASQVVSGCMANGSVRALERGILFVQVVGGGVPSMCARSMRVTGRLCMRRCSVFLTPGRLGSGGRRVGGTGWIGGGALVVGLSSMRSRPRFRGAGLGLLPPLTRGAQRRARPAIRHPASLDNGEPLARPERACIKYAENARCATEEACPGRRGAPMRTLPLQGAQRAI